MLREEVNAVKIIAKKQTKKQTKTFYLNLKNKQTKNTRKQRETASFSPL